MTDVDTPMVVTICPNNILRSLTPAQLSQLKVYLQHKLDSESPLFKHGSNNTSCEKNSLPLPSEPQDSLPASTSTNKA